MLSAQVLRQAVRLTGNVRVAMGMLVDVVLSLQQLLGLGDCRVDLDPGVARGQAELMRLNPGIKEPRRDSRDRILAIFPRLAPIRSTHIRTLVVDMETYAC